MRRLLQSTILLLLFCFNFPVWAQSSQVVNNGQLTQAENFSGAGCIFNWVNDRPGIGLPATGSGNIAPFTALNAGSSQVIATIKATPAPTGYAYITNIGSNTVSVVNVTTNTVIKTIHVGNQPNGVAISADGSLVYITNQISNTVSVIRTDLNQVASTINNVGPVPIGVTVSPNGSKIYVVNSDNGINRGTVSVINTGNNAIVATILLGKLPQACVLSPDGSVLYVSNYNDNNISVIRTSDNTITSTIAVGISPCGEVLSPDGSLLYVTNTNSRTVSVIKTADNSTVATITVGQGPAGITISPDGSKVYVANELTNNISVINTSNNTVEDTFSVNNLPYGVSVSSDGSRLYVTNYLANNVSVINTSNNSLLTTFTTGTSPASFGGSFITKGAVCSPVTFTITVNSSPPGITASAATGTISGCAGSASVSPNIQQFTVSGNGLSGNIIAGAPPGFEVSLTAGSGYDNSVTLISSGGSVNNKVIYVRSAASATGNISGNVSLQSTGVANKSVSVKGVVNALATVNSITNQVIANGSPTDPVNFTGAGNTFNWVNNKPGIGLAASGTGNIASFTGVNTGTSPIIATVAVTPLNSALAYICNSGSGNVSVINTGTNKVIATIPVGTNPLGAASSPDGTRMYIANSFTNNVSIINTVTNAVIATIAVGTAPQGVVVSPDGNHAYVASNIDGTVSVINTSTNSLDAVIQVQDSPASLCISPDGSRLYVANTSSNSVSIVNTADNSIINTIGTGYSPIGIAISPDGNRVYVTNPVLSSISVYNAFTTNLIKTIAVGTDPIGVSISPDGSRAYVSNTIDGTISVINTANNKVIKTINVGVYPYGISITEDGKRVYVTDQNSNEVSVIDAASNVVIATIPVGTAPASLGNFITKGTGCSGPQTSFTITVNAAVPTITVSGASGIISACIGSASASPNIQQFTVSGSTLTTGVTVTAPAGFEISLSKGSGYLNNLILNQSGGTVSNKVVYVRSAASATGNISGNIILTSAGATIQSVLVNGNINALPLVDKPGDQSLPTGTNTTAVNFTGTGNYFTWTIDKPSIGLAASGEGNIASFTAINTGSSPVIATVTVTPKSIGYAYIVNQTDDNVSVINTLTNAVIATIPVGRSPYDVVASPDGSRMYVVNRADKTVSVINTSTNTVITTIYLSDTPHGITISPDGSKVYVSINGSSISVINTSNNTVSGTIGGVLSPYGLTSNADGSKLYVTDYNDGKLSVINIVTGTVTAIVTIGPGTLPTGSALSADGSMLYVVNQGANSITVINTATNAIVTTLQQAGKLIVPVSIAISPDGGKAYVANAGGNTVAVINTASNTIITTIPVGTTPIGISFNSDGLLYVANANSNNVSVIDPASNSVVGTVNVGTTPTSMGNFISQGSNCPGVPVKFTITVDPSLALITAGLASGTISACAGSASASPDLQQATVSGSDLAGAITATAPNNFEISLSPTVGFGNSLILNQSGGNVANTIIYVRSSAGAVGAISGNITLTSAGAADKTIAVAGIVNALPTVNKPTDQSHAAGTQTTAVNFTGSGNTFTWINDTPSIGLAASGAGNIAPFTAINANSSPVKATITVTPSSANYAYAVNSILNSVSVINTATKAIVAVIPVGRAPSNITVSPDGSKVYVVNVISNSVSVINTATNLVTATIGVQNFPEDLAISADGKRLYVSNANSNSATVIDAIKNAVITNITVGNTPLGLSVSPNGSRVYVSNGQDNTVSVINTGTNAVIATLNVGLNPNSTVTSPDGKWVYVVNALSNTVSVIKTSGNTLYTTIPVGAGANSIAISADGSRLYVSNMTAGSVSVINTATNAVETTIPVSADPAGLSLGPDNQLYVVDPASGIVSVINTASNSVSSTFSGGSDPVSIAVSPVGTGCSGVPVTFTITVTPAITALITAGPVSGAIYACAGSPSTSPDIQQFTISGSNLTAAITAAAPGGFEISLAPGSGYGSSLTLNQSGGKVLNTVIYVRSSASATGDISGNVVFNTIGAVVKNVLVKGIVNAAPTVNAISDKTYSNSEVTAVINFTGTGNTFNWTNDKPGIGLPASGTGDIPPFTAINTGSSPVTANISVTPTSAGIAYVANEGSNNVSVINTISNTVVSTIWVGHAPNAVAASADGSRVYVTNLNDNTVSVINTSTNSVIATIPVGNSPYCIIVSPDGNKVYVTNFNGKNVSVINTLTNTVTATITTGNGPYGIALSPDGGKLYVSNFQDQTVSVFNTINNSKIATVNVGSFPDGISVNPNGKVVYVVNSSDFTISVIDAATNVVTDKINVEAGPVNVIFNADGTRAYVTNAGQQTVSVINTATKKAIVSIPVGIAPNGLSLNSDGTLYVTNAGGGNVSVINTVTNTVTGTIDVGMGPSSFGNFISRGSGCTGVPVKFTITVNTLAIINAGLASGYISSCAGTPSASPNIQQFPVSASGLTNNIVVTAPAGFQVSLSAGGGYGNSVTLVQSGGKVSNKAIYVRSAISAIGSISGNVTLVSAGAASQNVFINGFVSALPTADAVPPQVLNNGDLTNAVSFTSTANTFVWTNDKPGIGLAASGMGDIGKFTAINTGSTPIVATVTVTPLSAGFAYIINRGDGTVSVINTTTNLPVSTMPVGTNPYGVALSPDGGRMYVTNYETSGTVTVVNTSTQTKIATIAVGSNPTGILVSHDGSRLYVTNSGSNTLTVINIATNTVVATITQEITPTSIAESPDGNLVYVTNNSSGNILVINANTNAVAYKININSPRGILLSPDGKLLYVTSDNNNSVIIINTATRAVVANIATGFSPSQIALSPDGAMLYVTNSNSNSVSVINLSLSTAVATITVGTYPTGVSVSADGSTVYVANQGSNNVSVINTATNALITTTTVGQAPFSIGNFTTPNITCPGDPVTFTITVKPAALLPVIIVENVSGSISACVGSPSASPNVQQIKISGNDLSAGILATAPAKFEVSLDPNNGYANSVTINQVGGKVTDQIVYVRSAAADPAGVISGSVKLTSAGATTKNANVTGIINALPTVNAVANQTHSNGQLTDPVNFTGTGNVFAWVNDKPGIGLAASGTGDIAAFNVKNTGTTPITATVTVIPQSAGYAYIGNTNDNTVTVINTITKAVVATIPVGQSPAYISVSPNGQRVYVVNNTSQTISVISTATNKVIATIPVPPPNQVKVSPNGSLLYLTDNLSNTVLVINASTYAVVSTIPVGAGPAAIAVSPDGSRVYVTNITSGNVSVINTADNSVISTINVGLAPSGIAISPDGSRVYVTNFNSNTVSVINTAINAVTSTINTGTNPSGISLTPDGNKGYVTNYGSNTVSVFSTSNNAILSTIAVGINPLGISVNPDGSSLYVVNLGSDNVSLINTTTDQVASTIAVGSHPGTDGDFIVNGTGCEGIPIKFTITVNPAAVPVITATGTPSPVTTTYGTPSPSTSFTVSGSNLTAGILVTPPAGLEVSTDNINFSNTVLVGISGNVTPQTVYLRLKATTFVGPYPGNIVLTSAGATDADVATINNVVKPAPLTITANDVNKPAGTVITGTAGAVEFTAMGLQNSETISSVTVAYGVGAEASAANGTYVGSIVASAATGGTFTAGNYTITYKSGDIIVFSVPVTSIITIGTLASLTTIYGTPSSTTSFNISGNNLTAGILITPPDGFEVSIDGINFTNTLTVGTAGTLASTTIYIRLKGTANVGSYPGDIKLSTAGTADVKIPTHNGVVTPALLTITTSNVTKTYGTALTGGPGVTDFAITVGSLQNGNTIKSITIAYGPGAEAGAGVATYPGSVKPSDAVGGNGFLAGNYSFTFLNADIIVNKALLTIGADDQSKKVGADNPPLTVTYSGFVNGEGAAQLTVQPQVTTTALISSPAGQYIITAAGAESPNYGFSYKTGILTVNPIIKLIVINNTFTPNADGINDTWIIKNLDSYPNNTVDIYNRYGEKVYSSVGYGIPWDGTYKGKQLPTGTYYYIIDPKNDSKVLSGWVAIIR